MKPRLSREGASRHESWKGVRVFTIGHSTRSLDELVAERLRELTEDGRVAVMCAEAVPWRCHRSLVADALVARGAHVEHISALSRSTPHRMTPFASVRERVTYPGESGSAH